MKSKHKQIVAIVGLLCFFSMITFFILCFFYFNYVMISMMVLSAMLFNYTTKLFDFIKNKDDEAKRNFYLALFDLDIINEDTWTELYMS